MQGRGNNVISNKLITILKQTLSRISPKISLGLDPMSDFSISLEMNPKRAVGMAGMDSYG